MTIVNTLNTVFNFDLIAKQYDVLGTYTLKIKDKQKNSYNATFTASGVQCINDITTLTFTLINIFTEGSFYEAEFYLNGNLIFKDLLFSTSQSTSSYSINNGKFIEPTILNNEYIII